MKRKKLAAFGLVIALTVSSSSAAFAAAVPAASNMETTAVQQMNQAEETDTLHIKEDENSNVAWFPLKEAVAASTEPWFQEHIYCKLNEKLNYWNLK